MTHSPHQPDTSNGLERRLHPRYVVPHRAEVKLILPKGEVVTGQAGDMSIGGMSVRAAPPLSDGVLVDISTQLALDYGSFFLQSKALVRSIANADGVFRLGLQLVGLSKEQEAKLDRLLDYLRRHKEFLRTSRADLR